MAATESTIFRATGLPANESDKSTVFRVTGLPADKSDKTLRSSLKRFIRKNLLNEEKSKTKVDIDIVPSCLHYDEKVALVEFPGGTPNFLSGLAKNPDPKSTWDSEVGGTDISFDCGFLGFTQLYVPDPTKSVTAE
jgi:hypothetical protein